MIFSQIFDSFKFHCNLLVNLVNYNNILDSEEYDGTELVVPVGEVLAHVTVKDNYIKVFSYDQPISLEDLLKKNEYSPLKRT